MSFSLREYINESVHVAPLAVFRILFGAIIFISLVRFWLLGWIEDFYIKPQLHFPFYGFEFVKPIGSYIYIIFAIAALSALFILAGYKYRLATAAFFLSFTYIELIDKTYYLNHYYFVSLVGFILLLVPASSFFSVDASRNPEKEYTYVPRWTVGSIRLMLCLVYFFAGIAKLNSDWLLEALPLKIWLPSKYDLPIFGPLVDEIWLAYLFSWFGAFYDLFIWIFLLNRKTRPYAFPFVIIFHVFTAIFFPAIGMFPYIMLLSSLIFLDARAALYLLKLFKKLLKIRGISTPGRIYPIQKLLIIKPLLVIFFSIQILTPVRYLLYPGELFWSEEGFRFSWRVMLMEKAGMATFTVKDSLTERSVLVNNSSFLNPTQEKQMSFQPDMILQFAHFLGDYYKKKGFSRPQVFVESYVTLNGRPGQAIIIPHTDLYKQKEDFSHKDWIARYNHDIKGF